MSFLHGCACGGYNVAHYSIERLCDISYANTQHIFVSVSLTVGLAPALVDYDPRLVSDSYQVMILFGIIFLSHFHRN